MILARNDEQNMSAKERLQLKNNLNRNNITAMVADYDLNNESLSDSWSKKIKSYKRKHSGKISPENDSYGENNSVVNNKENSLGDSTGIIEILSSNEYENNKKNKEQEDKPEEEFDFDGERKKELLEAAMKLRDLYTAEAQEKLETIGSFGETYCMTTTNVDNYKERYEITNTNNDRNLEVELNQSRLIIADLEDKIMKLESDSAMKVAVMQKELNLLKEEKEKTQKSNIYNNEIIKELEAKVIESKEIEAKLTKELQVVSMEVENLIHQRFEQKRETEKLTTELNSKEITIAQLTTEQQQQTATTTKNKKTKNKCAII